MIVRMASETKLPPAVKVRRQITLCQSELSELRKLLRACESAERAAAARHERESIRGGCQS